MLGERTVAEICGCAPSEMRVAAHVVLPNGVANHMAALVGRYHGHRLEYEVKRALPAGAALSLSRRPQSEASQGSRESRLSDLSYTYSTIARTRWPVLPQSPW